MTPRAALRALVDPVEADRLSLEQTRAYGEAIGVLDQWPYRTLDIVRWHFNAADALLLVGCALAGLFASLTDLVTRP
jgi:hypothetical protein